MVWGLFECSALDGPVDWRPLQQLGSKAAVVYNPSDPWFSQYDTMREVLPGIEVSRNELTQVAWLPCCKLQAWLTSSKLQAGDLCARHFSWCVHVQAGQQLTSAPGTTAHHFTVVWAAAGGERLSNPGPCKPKWLRHCAAFAAGHAVGITATVAM